MAKVNVLTLIGGILGTAGGALLMISAILSLSQLAEVNIILASEGTTWADLGINEGSVNGILYSTLILGIACVIFGITAIKEIKISPIILLAIGAYVFVGYLVPVYQEYLHVGSYYLWLYANLVQTMLGYGDPIFLISGGVLSLIGVLKAKRQES
ncbi:MAG: hypothetical protein ACFFCS_15760 [Candidatus Hodarchaeota archaeon]